MSCQTNKNKIKKELINSLTLVVLKNTSSFTNNTQILPAMPKISHILKLPKKVVE
jgi:hypothetical protein